MKTHKNKTNNKHLPNKATPPVYITRTQWEAVMGSAGDNSPDTNMLEQILPLTMPEPVFDWIRLALCFAGKNYYDPKPLFEQKFGPATNAELFGIFCWKFTNGLYLSVDNFGFNYLLMLQASDALLAELNNFLAIVKLVHLPDARFKLAQAEIAFDFLLPDKSELEVEDIAIEFDRIATPRKHKAPRAVIESEPELAGDGAINGSRTVYDNRTRKTDAGRKLLKYAGRHEKIYPKAIDGIRRVRFEETLKRGSLERYIGTDIPKSVRVNDREKKVEITTFWDFYEFDYDAFRQAAYKLGEKKLDKKGMTGLRTLLHHRDFKTATGRNYLVYKIADYLGSDHLRRRIGKGDFRRPIAMFKA